MIAGTLNATILGTGVVPGLIGIPAAFMVPYSGATPGAGQMAGYNGSNVLQPVFTMANPTGGVVSGLVITLNPVNLPSGVTSITVSLWYAPFGTLPFAGELLWAGTVTAGIPTTAIVSQDFALGDMLVGQAQYPNIVSVEVDGLLNLDNVTQSVSGLQQMLNNELGTSLPSAAMLQAGADTRP